MRLAQLQLNRRRLPQRHALTNQLLPSPFRVKLYRSGPGRLSSLASLAVSAVVRDSWVAVDVTEAVRELLLDNRPSRRLLTVRFESPGGKPIPASHFLRGVHDKEYAFLILFSEDSDEEAVAEDGGTPPPRPPVHTHALVQRLGKLPLLEEQENNNLLLIPVSKNRMRMASTKNPSTSEAPTMTSTKGLAYDDFVLSYNITADGRKVRNTRSIINNQLHDGDFVDEKYSSNKKSYSLESEMTKRIELIPTKSFSTSLNKGKKGKRKKARKQKKSSITDLWDNPFNVSKEIQNCVHCDI